MTTATEDRLDELEAAKERLAEAVAEREKIDAEYRQWDAEHRADEDELHELAINSPDQFEGGKPRRGTKAAKLEKRIAEAKDNKWREIITGADGRTAEADREVSRLTDEHAVELAREEWRAAEAEVARLKEPAAEMLAAINALAARQAKLTEICFRTRSQHLDGRDVSWDPGLDTLRQTLERVTELQAPRSRSLTPAPYEEPPVVMTPNGWMHRASVNEVDPDLQPEREEPSR